MSTAPAKRSGSGGASPPARIGSTNELRELLDKVGPRLAAVLPAHLTPERVGQVVMNLAYRTPKLLGCERNSIISAIQLACELGLDLSRSVEEAYLIPRFNRNLGCDECTFLPSYKGLIKLAIQSGFVRAIRSSAVREGEPFRVAYTPALDFYHEPSFEGSRPVRAFYAAAELASGSTMVEVMTVEEIDAVRRRSMAGNNGPWVTDYNEMARKTVLRRILKTLPKSPALARAIEADEREYQEGPRSVVSGPPARVGPGGRSEALARRLAGAVESDDGEADNGPGETPGAADEDVEPAGRPGELPMREIGEEG